MSLIARVVARVSIGTVAVLCATCLVAPSAQAAQETRIAANGSITITSTGVTDTMPQPAWTFTTAGEWSCTTEVGYADFGLVQWFEVLCTPASTNGQGSLYYSCPLMAVSTVAAGVAGGYVECNSGPSLDTGVQRASSGPSVRQGNLGNVTTVKCRAYADYPEVLVGPYEVTCADPGLLTL